MKKQTLIVIMLCVLVASVIALSVTGVIGPQGSFVGETIRNNEVSSPVSIQPLYSNDDWAFPSCP